MKLFLVLSLAIPLLAQQPRVSNTKMSIRSAATGLETVFKNLLATQTDPAWIGYAVPAVAGHGQSCCGSGCCNGCALEKDSTAARSASSGPIPLEPSGALLVLFRMEQHRVEKIRTFSQECELDGGGLPFYWLTDVRPRESIALLATFSTSNGESAVAAIAQHADTEADRVLEQFVAPNQPEQLRRKATFWLGASRGRRGYEIVRRLVRDDASDAIREHGVFALSISKEPEAAEAMIEVARSDKSPHVRGKALFWIAQKAGKKATATIANAIENDPETEVKKKAVFALSQLKEEGVPMLIELARTNRNQAVRKQAMFWLGQSKDARALAFFEEVLKR